MAYMNQEKKAKLAPAIKAVLKKYRMKGTISVRNHSALVVTLQSGPIEFKHSNRDVDSCDHQVNTYWIDTLYTGTACKFLSELVDAMKGNEWYDRSDAQVDYFDTAYYIDINVGKWDKPYVVTA